MMATLIRRMGVQPSLPVRVSLIIDTMLNFDSDFDRDGRGHSITKWVACIHKRNGKGLKLLCEQIFDMAAYHHPIINS